MIGFEKGYCVDNFELELKKDFVKDALEMLENSEQLFVGLDKKENIEGKIEELFRLMHSLKGNSNAVGLKEFSQYAHELESFMLKIKNKEIPLDDSTVNTLLESNDYLVSMVKTLKMDISIKFDNSEMLLKIKDASNKRGSIVVDSLKSDEGSSIMKDQEDAEHGNALEKEKIKSKEDLGVYLQNEIAKTKEQKKSEQMSFEEDDTDDEFEDLENRYIEFSLGSEVFALSIYVIKEVVSIPETTPIPKAPDYFCGIMNLRGQVISIIDLRKKLQIAPSPQKDENAVIIIEIGRVQFGLVVDSINRVFTCPKNEINDMPYVDSKVKTAYIKGIYRKDNKLIVLLDIVKVLDIQDLCVL